MHLPKTNHSIRSYTVEMLGNVVDGTEVKYLNVDMETFKKIGDQSIGTRRVSLVWL